MGWQYGWHGYLLAELILQVKCHLSVSCGVTALHCKAEVYKVSPTKSVGARDSITAGTAFLCGAFLWG